MARPESGREGQDHDRVGAHRSTRLSGAVRIGGTVAGGAPAADFRVVEGGRRDRLPARGPRRVGGGPPGGRPLKLLLDSVILIDHFNGRREATLYLSKVAGEAAVSVITRAEVLAGFDPGD